MRQRARFPRIELEATFTVDSIVRPVDDSTVELLPEVFGGALCIQLYLTPERRVYAMVFQYEQGTNYDDQVRSYSESLGSPIRKANRAYWDDGRTRFTLYRSAISGVEAVSSRLVDLALARP